MDAILPLLTIERLDLPAVGVVVRTAMGGGCREDVPGMFSPAVGTLS
jgi:hypothetical protein